MSTYAIDPVTRVEPEPASPPELSSVVKVPSDATQPRNATPSDTALPRNPAPSDTTLPRNAAPSDATHPRNAAPSDTTLPRTAAPSDATLPRDAASSDATPTNPSVPPVPHILEASIVPPSAPAALKDAFIRQLQLDRLTLRQMRSWLMADDARRAIEVAAGATEATYERLALILFGADLPQLLGKQAAPPPNPGMSAEERLELQREKARIRARLRRAAAKAARQP